MSNNFRLDDYFDIRYLIIFIAILAILFCTGFYIGSKEKHISDKQILIQYCKTHFIPPNKISDRLIKSVEQSSKLYGIDRWLVYAVIIKESEFNRFAVNTNIANRTGGQTFDYGLMQINTIWNGIAYHCDDSNNNIMFYEMVNIKAGCFILSEKLKEEHNKNVVDGLKRYNGYCLKGEIYSKSVTQIYYELNKLR